MFLKISLIAVLTIGSTLSQNFDILTSPLKFNLNGDSISKAVDDVCSKANVTDPVVTKGVKDSLVNVSDCLKGFINIETVKNEIEDAKPRGALDEVFKKYCDKSANLKGCFKNLLEGVQPCVEISTPETIKAFDQLVDFVCHRDGTRVALFIAERGPECFQSMSSTIQKCTNDLQKYFTDIESAKKTTVVERCAKLDSVSECVVKGLEGCDTPTPANMFESLVKFIRRETPCNKL